MKNDYVHINRLLQYYVDNKSGLGVAPDLAAERSGLKIDKSSAFLMCKMMFDDGYLYLQNDNLTRYSANYKAKLFIDEGGYVTQKRNADRKKAASWMVETFDFLKYPLGIILAILGLLKILIDLNIIQVLKCLQ